MIGIKLLAPALVALLAAVPAYAQPAADADSEETAAAAEESATSSAADADNTDSAPRPPERSPTDYRASEQISEDLSVSFPVDI